MSDLVKADPGQLMGPESVIQQISRSESEVQAALAHRFPRDIQRATGNAMALATLNEEMAAACFYAMPRGGTTIEGPSVRLAEILAQCWGNLRASSYIIEVGETTVTARGVCWDLENNLFTTQDRSRRITKKNGDRYNDDMIGVTSNAACSVAYREAVFRCIGKAVVDPIWQECRRVAIGESRSVASSWSACTGHFSKMGVQESQLLERLGYDTVSQVTRNDIGTLRGLFTAIKDGEASLDGTFKPVTSNGDTVRGFGSKSRQEVKPAAALKAEAPPPRAAPLGDNPSGQVTGATPVAAPAEQPAPTPVAKPAPTAPPKQAPLTEVTIDEVYKIIQDQEINATQLTDLLKLKAPELNVFAASLGLDVRGKKRQVAERIVAHYTQKQVAAPVDPPAQAEAEPPDASPGTSAEDLPIWKETHHDTETGEGLPDLQTTPPADEPPPPEEEPPPRSSGSFGF